MPTKWLLQGPEVVYTNSGCSCSITRAMIGRVFLAQNRNRPHSRKSLLENVWGFNIYIGDPRTVDVHIRNLRQKIGRDPANPQLLQTERGSGYRFAA